MPTFKRINGKWQECQALVKEGGTWKEIGAVTAKANGKWADIKPPEPPVDPRRWSNSDFIAYNGNNATQRIKSELRQFFIVGDEIHMFTDEFADRIISTPIPGIRMVDDGEFTGIIETGAENIKDAIDTKYVTYRTADGSYIPIKPAP